MHVRNMHLLLIIIFLSPNETSSIDPYIPYAAGEARRKGRLLCCLCSVILKSVGGTHQRKVISLATYLCIYLFSLWSHPQCWLSSLLVQCRWRHESNYKCVTDQYFYVIAFGLTVLTLFRHPRYETGLATSPFFSSIFWRQSSQISLMYNFVLPPKTNIFLIISLLLCQVTQTKEHKLTSHAPVLQNGTSIFGVAVPSIAARVKLTMNLSDLCL